MREQQQPHILLSSISFESYFKLLLFSPVNDLNRHIAKSSSTQRPPPLRAAHILEIRALSSRDVYLRVYWLPEDDDDDHNNNSGANATTAKHHNNPAATSDDDRLSDVEEKGGRGRGERGRKIGGGDMGKEDKKKKKKRRRRQEKWLEMGIVDAAEVKGRAVI